MMKSFPFFICTFFIAMAGQTAALLYAEGQTSSRTNWATEAYKKNCEAVVNIQGDKIEEGTRADGKTYNGMGTGIIIDERGYIITNHHVVNGIQKIQVTTFDGKKYTAKLVGRDPGTDLAIIKIDARKPLKTITFGRSNDLMPGESCMAIGNPYGYTFSLTDGRISGINREIDVNETLVYRLAIQTNAEINPGNSGGPLININGEMIGINAAIRQGAAGIAFAIPADQVVEVAAKLISNIVESRINTGFTLKITDSEQDEMLNIIDTVQSNSAASAAGLKQGDILTSIGGNTLRNKLDVYRALLDAEPKDDIIFGIHRDGAKLDISVAFRRVSTSRQNIDDITGDKTRSLTSFPPKAATVSPKTTQRAMTKDELDELVWENLGIKYTPLTKEEYKKEFPQFVKQYPDGGIRIDEVRKGSSMSKGYITQGDVIVGIYDWVATSCNDVRFIAKNWKDINTDNGKVKITVFRDGQHYYAEVPLEQ